jgi:putative addiction module component (TIGR02574 family)
MLSKHGGRQITVVCPRSKDEAAGPLEMTGDSIMAISLESLGWDRLGLDEKLALVSRLWDDIIASVAPCGRLSDAHRQELLRRIVNAQAHPADAAAWEQVLAATLKRLSLLGDRPDAMTPEQFDMELRTWTKRRPFLPFVVELITGERITIEHPGVAFGGGVAGFLSPEEGLVDFGCEEVRSFLPYPFEAIS